MSLVIMLLEMGKVVKHISHHEFVEENDSQQSGPSDDGGNHFSSICR